MLIFNDTFVSQFATTREQECQNLQKLYKYLTLFG